MSKSCCFVSYGEEGDFSFFEKEKLSFYLSGALFYLTFAGDVKTYYFPREGYLPALANRLLNPIAKECPDVRRVLLLPKNARSELPFSFFYEKRFDDQLEIVPPLSSCGGLFQAMIDKSDVCFFYFDKKKACLDEKMLLDYAKDRRKTAVNLFDRKEFDSLFSA